MKPLALPVLLLLASCGVSESPQIELGDAWARPTLTPAQPAAVYLTITNSGKASDRLSGVSSERGRASLHSSAIEGVVVRMRPVAEGVAIPAGSALDLKPHGSHIMLEGLSEPLKPGTRFQLTLQFEKSGSRQAQVQVANGPAENHGSH